MFGSIWRGIKKIGKAIPKPIIWIVKSGVREVLEEEVNKAIDDGLDHVFGEDEPEKESDFENPEISNLKDRRGQGLRRR